MKLTVSADFTAFEAAVTRAHDQLTALETRASRTLQEPSGLLATAAAIAAVSACPRRISRRQLFGLGVKRG